MIGTLSNRRLDAIRHRKITRAATWCPGSFMIYSLQSAITGRHHVGIGVVLANTGAKITVLWDDRCRDRLCEYEISKLNHLVIDKL